MSLGAKNVTFEITGSDGERYQVEGPPGSSEADAVIFLETHLVPKHDPLRPSYLDFLASALDEAKADGDPQQLAGVCAEIERVLAPVGGPPIPLSPLLTVH